MSDVRPFHERFDIDVGVDEAKKRFVNRVLSYFDQRVYGGEYPLEVESLRDIAESLANKLGERVNDADIYEQPDANRYIKSDFNRALQALEALYAIPGLSRYRERLDGFIEGLLGQGERDLGIRWEKGTFVKSGAQLLDSRLVNEPLRWLRGDPSFSAVLIPFEKGLVRFLEAGRDSTFLTDVINNMHEAVEALAQIVTGRKGQDLSANREAFISSLRAPEAYKKILKEYVEYANDIARHAQKGAPKPAPGAVEVESFIYLTGLFIRAALLRRPSQRDSAPAPAGIVSA